VEVFVPRLFADPMLLPPVRWRARFTAEGFVFRRARDRPHDGFALRCGDPDHAIALLTGAGAETTRTPGAWVAAHRRESLLSALPPE
jgi:hypothetical protein